MEKTKNKKIMLTKEQSLILRDLKFEDKVEKIKQMFPSGQAEELIKEFSRREEKKLHTAKREQRKKADAEAARLENERIQKKELKKAKLYRIISFLNECLAKKYCPSEAEVQKIKKWMTHNDYIDFRDQYIQIICVAFYFEADQSILDEAAAAESKEETERLEYLANPVKAEATAFIDYVMGELHLVEMAFIERCLSGGYISSKTHFLLKKHCQIIHEGGNSQWIIDKISKMLQLGYVEGFVCRDGVCKLTKSSFNAKKIAMMQELVDIYSDLQAKSEKKPALKIEAHSFEEAAAAQGIEA